MARVMRRPISQTCRTCALVSGSKARLRTVSTGLRLNFAIQIDFGIRQHLVGSPTQRGGSDRGRGRARCRPCEQAVEAVLDTAAEVRELAGAAAPRGHTAEAAATHRVDRSTVVRIREVAKLGALAALPESRPGAGYPPVTGTQHRTSLTGHFLLLLLSSD